MEVNREVTRVLQSVGHEIRIRILLHLASKGSSNFTDLIHELNLTGGKLNFHIRKLRDAGLINVNEKGLYELTSIGRWIVTRLRELGGLYGESKKSTLIDYRGVPKSVSFSEIARKSGVGYSNESEEVIARIWEKLSSSGEPVSEEILGLLAEIELIGKIGDYICLPPEVSEALARSYASREYSGFREELCENIISLKTLRNISQTLYDYQLKGLVFVRNPIYTLTGAQTVFLQLRNSITKTVARLIDYVDEIVVLIDKVDQEELKTIDNLIPPGKVTVVIDPNEPPIDGFRRLGVVIHDFNEWSESILDWLTVINSPVCSIISRGGRIPSISLAEAPVPDAEKAYILPIRVAVPLTTLYVEVKQSGLDAYNILEHVAQECLMLSAHFNTGRIVSRLKGLVENYEVLSPQLALTGFEAAMRMHHRDLRLSNLIELANRFWKSISRSISDIDVSASMPDEKLYSNARTKLFNPLSSCVLSIERSFEEWASVEGATQGVLQGGSVWPVASKSHLFSETLIKTLCLAMNRGIFRVTFHLEFTVCELCGAVAQGLRGICSLCLSNNVTHLIRPLTIYKPSNLIPDEVKDEYRTRISIEGLKKR
ncbi:MAG: winged helix-turn-helix transcriptional regulator [Thermofilaceae archaeon]